MTSTRLYLHRLASSSSLALTSGRNGSALAEAGEREPWHFWMQFTRTQMDPDVFGVPLQEIDTGIATRGFFRFESTAAFAERFLSGHSLSIAIRPYGQEPITVYLYQCGSEELYAVTEKQTAEFLPRSSCTQGWQVRGQFQLNTGVSIPLLVDEKAILQGLSRDGYYIWRGSEAAKADRDAPKPD